MSVKYMNEEQEKNYVDKIKSQEQTFSEILKIAVVVAIELNREANTSLLRTTVGIMELCESHLD